MGGYYSFNDQMKDMFKGKVFRLSLSSGCSCPNRDGTLSNRGCIFCSAGGSGEFAADAEDDILIQIEKARKKTEKKVKQCKNFAGYMAYFQPFSNTYGDAKRLSFLFNRAAALDDIVALSVATRPDCLEDEMIYELSLINEKKPVFVELGLQSIHEDTAQYINRCFSLSCFEDAFIRLKKAGIRVVVHIMAGLPGENADKTRQSVEYISALEYKESFLQASGCRSRHIDAVKLSLLYVLKETDLAKLLPDKPQIIYGDDNPSGYIVLKDGMVLSQYSLDEYVQLIKDLIEILPKGCAVHRITGDAPKDSLILPKWPADKKRILNAVMK